MPHPLRLIHPSIQVAESVEVGFGLAGDRLRVRFNVSGPALHVNPDLPRDAPQWGLWDWDVVELFLHVAGPTGDPLPYFEFQVSPLGQNFELFIRSPRKDTDTTFRSGFKMGATILQDDPNASRWEAWMEVPLKPLGWDGKVQSLRGGAFSILGPPDRRRYWSLFLPKQERPDFHLPAYFRALLD